jgi:UrcA family protein
MNTALTHTGKHITTVILGTAAALMMSTLSLQTANAASPDAPTVVVQYDGSTIVSASGARALYKRIELAARQVCPDDSTKDLARAAAAQRCQKDAVERAVRDIGNPQLAKLLSDLSNHG